MEGETCRVQLPSGPTDFMSTSVRPYLREHQEQQLEGDPAIAPELQENEESPIEDTIEGPASKKGQFWKLSNLFTASPKLETIGLRPTTSTISTIST